MKFRIPILVGVTIGLLVLAGGRAMKISTSDSLSTNAPLSENVRNSPRNKSFQDSSGTSATSSSNTGHRADIATSSRPRPRTSSASSSLQREVLSSETASELTHRQRGNRAAAYRPSQPNLAANNELMIPISVDPASPGNQLTAHGQLVQVTAKEPAPEGDALHVLITPSNQQNPSSALSGFTLEEELFRTRWGWEAFDRIQKAARQAASLPQ